MTNAPRVVLLGDVCVDLLMGVDMYPEHGADGIADRLEMLVGGGTANSAIVLSRLGLRATPLACMGADSWADFLRQHMQAAGLEIQYLYTRAELTTALTYVVVTPDGERTMFSYRGANTACCPDDVVNELFEGAGWLHLSSYALLENPQRDALWRAVELAQERGIPVSLDLNDDVVLRQPDEVMRLLPALHTCVLGRPEVTWLGGEGGFAGGLERLLETGVKLAAVKLGSDGCLLATPEGNLSIPSFPIQVADTTGAGDAFSAGIVYAGLHGLSIKAAAVLASALGALSASVSGAGLALPGRAEVLSFLRRQPASSEGAMEVIERLGNQAIRD